MELSKLLLRVSKPARYVGGEYNAVVKNWDQVDVKVAFAFPDVYEVGMSYLGLQILYHTVNARPDALLERVFSPWPDMEAQLRSRKLPLFSLESRRPLCDFDLLAITLQYELTYTNVLNLLDLAGIPLYAEERGEGYPLVVGGGPCAYNPEPLAPFFDLFILGDGEEAVHELLDLWLEVYRRGEGDKQDFLRQAATRPGFYVPSLYRQEGTAVLPRCPGVPTRVRKRVLADLDQAPFPSRPLVPWVEAVHDRAMLEVFRGCTRGCRFCQAGMIYRPVREKRVPTLVRQGEAVVRSTGYDELSLTSLSTADYTCLLPLLRDLGCLRLPHPLTVSLPSLRVDAFAVGVAERLVGKKTSLTFAPEAGTQRLRDVINKKVTEEDLLRAAEAAFNAGWQRLKLYFMLGLPTETRADVQGIGELVREVLAVGARSGVPRGRLRVAVSVAGFVPKAHTPFQWEPQVSQEELRGRIELLRQELRRERRVELSWHHPQMSWLEAVLARGDRRLAPALVEAWRRGCRFDGWLECFSWSRWEEALAETGIDPRSYAQRRYSHTEVLPWEHLDTGVSKEFLMAEHHRAYLGETTPDCREGRCVGCGVCSSLGIRPVLAEEGKRVSLSAGIR
ncbi:TIGR03960 family B12-binding radical SAM protein [Desulfothermobacter acidiphilus]|uniref:TIGR03960 family B12-binding radical SAM protein n=1 Tax=Desulfothermobacter acidiphilus TaxID=1938353 RepID=UPI003F8C0709